MEEINQSVELPPNQNPKTKPLVPRFLIIVIAALIIIVIGILIYINQLKPAQAPTTSTTRSFDEQTSQATLSNQTINTPATSASDQPDNLEKDLQNTNLDILDQELQNLDTELSAP